MLPVSLALFAKYAPKAINATIIGLYYLAFFFANSMVGWVGGFYQTMPTTNFWLMHAGFAAAAGALLRHLQIRRQPPAYGRADELTDWLPTVNIRALPAPATTIACRQTDQRARRWLDGNGDSKGARKPMTAISTAPRALALCLIAASWLPGLAFGHGAIDQRIRALTAQIERSPGDGALYFQLAEANYEHEDWAAADDALTAAEKFAPGRFPTDLVRGKILLAARVGKDAKAALDRFLAAHPGDAQALLSRARAWALLGKDEPCLADYRAALAATSRPEPDLFQEAADAMAVRHRPDEAVLVLDSGIKKLGPIPALVLRATTLEAAAGRFDAALSRMDEMEKSAPRPEPWMAKRAALLDQAGRATAARAAWEALGKHLAALPNSERESHAMSMLAVQTQQALAGSGSRKAKAELSTTAASAPADTSRLEARATRPAASTTVSSAVSLAVSGAPGSGELTRGPYLQKAGPTRMTLRWRSSQPVAGRVRYGVAPGSLDQTADESSATNEHVIELTGLTARTTYFYSVGSAVDTLASGVDFTFTTPPSAGTVIDTRIWVLGDAGTASSNQTAVRDAFYNWTGARVPNLVLQLGDNAYDSGLDTEFQAAVFNIYPTMLRQTPFWSCLGNHETAQSTAYVDTYPYFDIYTFPTAGECGGVPSGTEHYYSFDYGNIHFISLDSMTADRSPAGAMAAWLQNDLASTTATWIVCFFHHPPYTKGSHNSDTETELIQMRTNFLPILEAGGADLVLSGHSHCYERSFLLDGHYGTLGHAHQRHETRPGRWPAERHRSVSQAAHRAARSLRRRLLGGGFRRADRRRLARSSRAFHLVRRSGLARARRERHHAERDLREERRHHPGHVYLDQARRGRQ